MTKSKQYKHAGRVDIYEEVDEPKETLDWGLIAALIFWAFVAIFLLGTCSG